MTNYDRIQHANDRQEFATIFSSLKNHSERLEFQPGQFCNSSRQLDSTDLTWLHWKLDNLNTFEENMDWYEYIS